ncbi:hypothetical protein [Alloalcanivorax marinus]|uniref:hypothetical protein n=1 Tax=Alloalcanivorax marinus TaxID=1177169 RepID=UPI0019344B3A|nr:hypothetical protein [Alloalcanivorax marinus]MBL7252042.1 hypothetical protein [Alloalcanivorax marinus]
MARTRNPFGGRALLLILAVLIGGGAYGFHEYQHGRTLAQARSDAQALSRQFAGTLATLLNRDREQLQQRGADPSVRERLASGELAPGPWNDDARLWLIADQGTGEEELSFVFQDLLRQVRESGEPRMSSRGGEQPAVLLARNAPGGALILERRLTPWLDQSARDLPPRAMLTLEQGGLTLIRYGQADADAPRAQAAAGPLSVAVTVPPAPPFWSTWLIPGGAGIAALLLIAALVPALRRLRGTPATEPATPGVRRPAAKPAGPSPAAPAAPPSAPEPAPEPASPPPPTVPADLLHDDHLGGATLKTDTLARLARALGGAAGEAGQHTLFAARSPATGDDPYAALLDGLAASGRQVMDLGAVPRPVLYYATEVLESQTGLYLSGQRLEVRLQGERLTGEALAAAASHAGPAPEAPGTVEQRELTGRYLRALGDDIILARPMKVAVFASPGATDQVAAVLLEELGCRAVPVEGRWDPTDPATLAPLGDTVTGQNLDLGLAFDDGGGRLAAVASDGAVLGTDRLLMLFARDLLSRNPGSDVLFDVECSPGLGTLIRKQSGRPVMTPAGAAALQTRLRETGAPLAGDMSGHICFADRWFGFEDGLYAAARLLEILSLQAGDSAAAFAALTD